MHIDYDQVPDCGQRSMNFSRELGWKGLNVMSSRDGFNGDAFYGFNDNTIIQGPAN